MSTVTTVNVLQRALDLVSAGSLPGRNCSDFCPWCAIAIAKTALDLKHGEGNDVPPEEYVAVLFGDIMPRYHPSDAPLAEARELLQEFADVNYEGEFIQAMSVDALTHALALCRNGRTAKEPAQ